MLIEEKKKRYREFIQSKDFTLPSYASLSLFQMNIGAMNNIIRREATLAQKLMDSTEHDSPDSAYIQLDILCKIMMMIEGQCALVLALDSGKNGIAKGMSYFSSNIVGELGEKLDKSRPETKESFMWRVLSLPDIDSLNSLSQDEQSFLKRALAQTCEINYERLAGAINFYLSNKIAYNKFKHGLSILPLISSASSDARVDSMLALDRGRKRPAHKVNLLLVKGPFFPKDFEWYNTICLISVGKENLERYMEISESIYDFVSFIVQNSLLYADNCGVDYLPIKQLKDDKVEPWLYVRHPTPDVIEEIKAIYSKVLPNTNISLKRIGRFEFNLGKRASEKLAGLLKFVGSAVIWASDENIEAPNFLSEAKMS